MSERKVRLLDTDLKWEGPGIAAGLEPRVGTWLLNRMGCEIQVTPYGLGLKQGQGLNRRRAWGRKKPLEWVGSVAAGPHKDVPVRK